MTDIIEPTPKMRREFPSMASDPASVRQRIEGMEKILVRMGGNIGFDMLLGLIPWIGAVPDFFFRSNTRNLRIVKRHLDKHHPHTKTIEMEAAERP